MAWRRASLRAVYRPEHQDRDPEASSGAPGRGFDEFAVRTTRSAKAPVHGPALNHPTRRSPTPRPRHRVHRFEEIEDLCFRPSPLPSRTVRTGIWGQMGRRLKGSSRLGGWRLGASASPLLTWSLSLSANMTLLAAWFVQDNMLPQKDLES